MMLGFIKTLDQLTVGDSATVVSVAGEGALRRRLLDMGITPRTPITLKKIAPMGDPIEVRLRGYVLSLRLADAAQIQINTITTERIT